MAVLTPVPTAAASVAVASCPACSLQRTGSLWQLGIEAQELTIAIGQLAEQLEADDDDTRSQALAELEAALLAEEDNKAALAAKADATCWVIEHLGRAHGTYRVLVLTRLQPTATRFSFLNHELTSRKSQALEIDDEQALGPEWLTVKTTSQPDKAAIKEALKAGHLIPGAQLISRRSWRIH